MQFFDKFPTTFYDVQLNGYGYRYLLTNVLFRMTVLNAIKNNSTTYYDVQLTDRDTMEILAEKVYGSPEWHWLIAYTNDYTNPQFDWPMEYDTFNRHLISKYGSIPNATSAIHHYECRIERKDNSSQNVDTTIYRVDQETYDSQPHYSYTAWTLDSGITIEETITYAVVNAYDWELAANEAKRKIKLIRREFIPQIQQEFINALKDAGAEESAPFYRSLRNY